MRGGYTLPMTVLDDSSTSVATGGPSVGAAPGGAGVLPYAPQNAVISIRPAGGGIFYIFATLIGWASVLLFLKYLAGSIDAWTANGWRYGLSAVMWLPLVLAHTFRRTLPPRMWQRALLPALFNAAGQICFGLAPYFIGAGFAAFLIRISVVTAMVGAFVLFADERVLLRNPWFWVGLVLVVGGSAGTVLFRGEGLGQGTMLGVALGAGAGICYGAYSVSVRYFMHGVSSMLSFGVIALYTAVILVAAMLLFARGRGGDVRQLTAFGWAMLGLSALVGIAVGHVFYYSAIARLGVAISNGILQMAPFLTAVGSYLLFGEVLTTGQWVCGATLFVGAVVLLRTEQTRQQALARVGAGMAENPPSGEA